MCTRAGLAKIGCSAFSDYPKNCRTNPLSRAILPSSRTYRATPSCRLTAPSPPHGAPTIAARKSSSASPWACPGMAPSCSCSPKTLTDCLRLVERPVHHVILLALVDELVAMTTQEVAPRSVQDCHPAATSRSRTDKSRPLSTEVAGSPVKGHAFLYVCPFSAWITPVAVCQDHPLRLLLGATDESTSPGHGDVRIGLVSTSEQGTPRRLRPW